MMLHIRVSFWVRRTPEGTIHVQNYIGGLRGQHHVHTPESFERWRRNLGDEEGVTIHEGEGPCSCGLTEPGQVREYDGREWFNPRFLSEDELTARANVELIKGFKEAAG